jgi:hypothetical protein
MNLIIKYKDRNNFIFEFFIFYKLNNLIKKFFFLGFFSSFKNNKL